MEKVDCRGKILAVFISKHAREAASGRVSVSPCIQKELPVTAPVDEGSENDSENARYFRRDERR